jgi:hypothetical protein
MAHREDNPMAKAHFTAYLMLAWDLVSEEVIHRGWTCYPPDTRALERWSESCRWPWLPNY